MSDIITNPAKYQKGWVGGLPETPCGFGSKMSETEIQRKWIPQTLHKHGIKSVADIGAGDLNWIKHTDLGGIEYQAYDLVPRQPEVTPFNILTDELPEADCYMVLWVMNHFPEEMARIAANKLVAAGKHLLMTWESRLWDFLDLGPVESVVIRHRPAGDYRGNVELRLIAC
jgi:hypothetical protein